MKQILKIMLCVLVIQLKQVLAEADNELKVYELSNCTRFHTENITGGSFLLNGSYQYMDKVYPPGHFEYFNHYLHENGTEIETELHVRGCICTHSDRKCIRVCCEFIREEDGNETLPEICPNQFDGQIFHNITKKEISIQQHYTLVYDDIKCTTDPETGEAYDKVEFGYDFHENGSIFVQDDNTFLDYNKHCVSVDSKTQTFLVLRCGKPEGGHEHRYRMLGIGMLMSVPFLLITFIVYGAIPELQNTHGMSLMSYVGGLMVGCTFLATVHIIKSREACVSGDEPCIDPWFCTISGYTIYFSFMLSFFWLNTMCFNIFWTFRRVRVNTIAKNNFMYYCMYAWGMPTFLTALTFLLDVSNINKEYKPGMYFTQMCFLKHSSIVEFLYLYMILLILVCTNIVFFVITAYRIKKVQSETSAIVDACDSSRHSKHKDDKFRFLLYLRLFIIMGATWSMEILSWFIDSDSPWFYVTDLVNCFQGVLIFLIVVCNDQNRKLIVKRFYYFFSPASSDTRTSLTGFSMTGH